jgi:hypothetical protein
MAAKRTNLLPVIGWREWVALPELGVPRIKVKVDTGARSSSLHAFDIQVYRRRGAPMVRFNIHPYQRDARATVHADAAMIDERMVRTSGGHETLRPVIVTGVELMGRTWPIEVTLVGRDEMGFRMLLGRQALRGQFMVDPGRSYLGDGGPVARRRKKKARRT